MRSFFVVFCIFFVSLSASATVQVVKVSDGVYLFKLLGSSAEKLAASLGDVQFQSNTGLQEIFCSSNDRCEIKVVARALTKSVDLFPNPPQGKVVLIAQTDAPSESQISQELYNLIPGREFDTTIDFGNGSVYRGTAKALNLLNEGFFLACEHTTQATGATVVGYDCTINALVPGN